MKRRKSATDPAQLTFGFTPGPAAHPISEPSPSDRASQKGPAQQLAMWCQRHPVDPKIFFVPSRQIGRNLVTALAASGSACANLTVTTPLEHALGATSPSLEAQGWRRLRFDADLLILREILDRPAPDGPLSPFDDAVGPGLLRALLRTVRALKAADIHPDALTSGGVHELKARSLASIYAAFTQALDERKLYDDAHLYKEAIRRANRSISHIHTAILDETPLSGLSCDYVSHVAAGSGVRITPACPGVPAPPQSAAVRLADWPRADGGEKPPPREPLQLEGRPHIRIAEALGAETEVRGVLRHILVNGIPLDEVEVAYTSERPYLHLLYAASVRFDIPVTFGEGIPGELTRPGRALCRFLKWLRNGLPADDLVDLFRSGLLSQNGPSGSAVARVLRNARIHGGRGQYTHALRRQEADLADQVKNGPVEWARSAQYRLDMLLKASKRIHALLDLAPEGEKIALGTFISGIVTFLEAHVAHPDADSQPPGGTHSASNDESNGSDGGGSSPRDRPQNIVDSYVDRLEGIARSVTWEAPLPDLVALIQELLVSHKAEAASANSGCLNVVPLERAGYAGRKHLLVLGMDEGVFPGGSTEDPILLDAERLEVSEELSLQQNRSFSKIWHLDRVVHSGAESTLVVSSRNIAEARDLYPSPYLVHIRNQLGINGSMLPLIPTNPDESIDEAESLLSGRNAGDYAAKILEAWPTLGRGEIALQSRKSTSLGRFDGWLGAGDPELDPRHSRHILSASRLEMLVKCPYKYFLRYVLGINPPDELPKDPSRWLTPLESGSLLHELFRDFMSAVYDSREQPDWNRHAGLMAELLQKAVAAWREQIPVTHEDAYRADLMRLEAASRLFLSSEAARTGRKAVGFEVSFGFGEQDGLSQGAPARVHLSESVELLLRGRIDRVDRVDSPGNPPQYEVWDYKTGSAIPFNENDLLGGGLNLQWALYAYALEEISAQRQLSGSVVESGYFFPSIREHGRRMSEQPPAREEVARLLSPLLEMARHGAFFHIQKTRWNQCTFCEYRSICQTEYRLSRDFETAESGRHIPDDIVNQLEKWHRSEKYRG